MVIDLAEQAGIGRDRMYFNIARVGNTSAASIPLAIHDAVREGVLSAPTRVFTPGFGAGAVAGYAVLRIDPAGVAPEPTRASDDDGRRPAAGAAPHGVGGGCRGSLWRLTHGRDRSGFTARRPPTRNAAPTRLRPWGGDVTLLPEGVRALRPQKPVAQLDAGCRCRRSGSGMKGLDTAGRRQERSRDPEPAGRRTLTSRDPEPAGRRTLTSPFTDAQVAVMDLPPSAAPRRRAPPPGR